MNETQFKNEMRRAETLLRSSDRPDYWAGYIRGLRRSFHGKAFGTNEEHTAWIDAINSPDESRKERGQGYCDGLSFGKVEIKLGRPSVGNAMFPAITVSDNLIKSMGEAAKRMGISMAEARRQAYQKFVEF